MNGIDLEMANTTTFQTHTPTHPHTHKGTHKEQGGAIGALEHENII